MVIWDTESDRAKGLFPIGTLPLCNILNFVDFKKNSWKFWDLFWLFGNLTYFGLCTRSFYVGIVSVKLSCLLYMVNSWQNMMAHASLFSDNECWPGAEATSWYFTDLLIAGKLPNITQVLVQTCTKPSTHLIMRFTYGQPSLGPAIMRPLWWGVVRLGLGWCGHHTTRHTTAAATPQVKVCGAPGLQHHTSSVVCGAHNSEWPSHLTWSIAVKWYTSTLVHWYTSVLVH